MANVTEAAVAAANKIINVAAECKTWGEQQERISTIIQTTIDAAVAESREPSDLEVLLMHIQATDSCQFQEPEDMRQYFLKLVEGFANLEQAGSAPVADATQVKGVGDE